MKKAAKTLICIALSFFLQMNITHIQASEDERNLTDNINKTTAKTTAHNEFESLYNQINEIENTFPHIVFTPEGMDAYAALLVERDAYKNFIYSLNDRSDEELKYWNYTDEQINAIRNYDGTDEMTLLASATVTGILQITNYTYNSSTNKTTATLKYLGSWNGEPFFKTIDTIGVAFNGSEANYIAQKPATVLV